MVKLREIFDEALHVHNHGHEHLTGDWPDLGTDRRRSLNDHTVVMNRECSEMSLADDTL